MILNMQRGVKSYGERLNHGQVHDDDIDVTMIYYYNILTGTNRCIVNCQHMTNLSIKIFNDYGTVHIIHLIGHRKIIVNELP